MVVLEEGEDWGCSARGVEFCLGCAGTEGGGAEDYEGVGREVGG